MFDHEDDVGVSLAHCVSQCLKMRKGVARSFRERYQRLDELHEQGCQVGDVCILGNGEGKFLYYLVTKPKMHSKPTLDSLAETLVVMKRHAMMNNVKAIHLPKIGSGRDKLPWNRVYRIIRAVFGNSGISIRIFH